jgi:Aerotolerance regulator N-terminal/von Willebrand factor type A domain
MTSFISLFGFLFLTPLAALGVLTAATAIPVIIHLLNRKRYVIVPWAAMRFLLAAQKKNVRRLKLEQWLLLAMRILICILLVAAMASVTPWAERVWQRFFPSGALGPLSEGRTHRVLVLDGSFSMATRLGDGSTRFDLAKAQAKAILARSASGDGFSMVFLTAPAQPIVGGPVDGSAKVAREIDDQRLPHGSADLAGGLHDVAELVIRPLEKYSRREVYFFTDLKQSSWPLPVGGTPADRSVEQLARGAAGDLAESWKRITASAGVVFVDVAREDIDNVAVTDLTLADPVPLVGVDTSVSTVVRNFSRLDRKQVKVELLAGRAGDSSSGLPTVEQRLIDLPAGGAVTVNFALQKQNRFREAGDHVLQARVEGDALGLDDVRSLGVKVRDTIPVALVNGKPAAEPLERASEWLARALYPFPETARLAGYPARPRVLNLAQFADAGLGDLTPFDCVFLCDVPRVSGVEAARLETHLRRGGSVVIGLGPNSAQNLDHYNRVLFNDGNGLLPGRLVGIAKAEGQGSFSLVADEESFQVPPLAAFRSDNERAGLTLPRFRQYVRMEAPPGGPARRIFSFLPSAAGVGSGEPKPPEVIAPRTTLDPAMLEWPKYRGRVIVYTSTFNTDWTNWPLSPTFPPFVQELLRFAVTGGAPQTVRSGEPLEAYLPAAFAGLNANWIRRDGDTDAMVETTNVVSQDDAGLARLSRTEQSGIYRLEVGSGRPPALFAVNVPTTAPGGGSESDLRRIAPEDIRASAPGADIQIVRDAGEIQARSAPATDAASAPEHMRPHGPAVARILLLLLFGLLLAEVLLAWRYGSARAAGAVDPTPLPPRRRILTLLWLVPAAACAIALVVAVHAVVTGEFLGFLGPSAKAWLERSLDVPAAAPGEGTRVRLEANAYLTGDPARDRWLVFGLCATAVVFICWVYLRERPAGSAAMGRRPWFSCLTPMAALRAGLVLLALLVLLPQLRFAFEREGWPDIVLIFDDSRSMATVDTFRDALVKDAAEELKKAWEQIAAPRIERTRQNVAELQQQLARAPSAPDAERLSHEVGLLETRLRDLQTPHRLNLVKALLASADRDWLRAFLEERQVRLHVYRASAQATRMAELTEPGQCAALLEEIIDIVPAGESSRLGDAVTHVLDTFRGGSLNGIVLFTDGITTAGEDLLQAARLAARAGVPLHAVGVGDVVEPPDVILSDLLAPDSVHVNDRVVFEARLRIQGADMPTSLPVTLYEMKDGKKLPLATEMVTPDAGGKPVKVQFKHTPTDPGEKNYVIEVPVQAGETEPGNNRLERTVYVEENKRLRVLYVEGYPRYEFRNIKTLFERETEAVRGNKTIELSVLLLSAHPEFARQDRSALARFPTSEELNAYDVVILGDVDPGQLPKPDANLQAIADFVKERGGGLLLIAGEQAMPHAYGDTPLASVLPITTDGVAARAVSPRSDDAPITTGYRPRLTPSGQSHALFRFVADEAQNADIWNRLVPQFWYCDEYRRKLAAEVLAVHPERPAEQGPGAAAKDEQHPLVLQQFVGAGRVLFFGFDETWRWRYREGEKYFNQFWAQAVRSLARARVGRIELRLDRQTAYRRDEPIQITVRFPEHLPPPPADTPVRVTVECRPLKQPGAPDPLDEPEHQTLTLAAREGTRATYETLLTRTPEGAYRFTLASPSGEGIPPRAEGRVLPPPGEMDRLQLNEVGLRRATQETHGTYYPLDRASRLIDELPTGPRVALDQPCPPVLLWNHWGMFLLAFSLLAAEWVLRKRWRLL